MGLTLNENDKKDILSKYSGDTSDQVLNHLKRNYPVYNFEFDWIDEPFKKILVDDRLENLQSNKKYLVGKIYNILSDEFPHLEEKILRRTIKKYLDGIK